VKFLSHQKLSTVLRTYISVLELFHIKFMFISFSLCCNHFKSLAYEIFYARKVDLFDKIKKYAKIKKSCSLKSSGHSFGTTFVLRLFKVFSAGGPASASNVEKRPKKSIFTVFWRFLQKLKSKS
jgi:hypothetical protein